MIAEERLTYIENRLKERDTLGLQDLAKELNVSTATIRRDFNKLEEKGLLVRVHSGAVGIAKPSEPQQVISTQIVCEVPHKPEINVAAKRAVAQRAATFVKEGECIFIDGGTSLAPLAGCLGEKNVKIVTPNLLVPQYLTNPNADVFIVGGFYRPYHGITVGHYAESMLSKFHYDRAFFGCSAVDLQTQTAYNNDVDTIPIKETVMQFASHKYLLLDASKLNATAFCRFNELNTFDYVISNGKDGIKSYPKNVILV